MCRASHLLILCLFLFGGSATAQEADGPPRERIELQDGTVLIGVVVAEDAATLRIRTASGVEMTVEKAQIVRRRRADEATLDPNRTRLLFAPTARAIPHGSGYFADYYIFFPFVGVGVGDVFSLAGGLSIIPGLGLGDQLLYLAPKATFYSDARISGAIGVLHLVLPDGVGSGGVAYAVGTLGPQRQAITLGVGFGYGGGDVSEKPALLLGGELQVTNSVKLITENYVFVGLEDGVLISGGLRFFGDRLSADLGLITVPAALDEIEGFPLVPLVSFAYNFGL